MLSLMFADLARTTNFGDAQWVKAVYEVHFLYKSSDKKINWRIARSMHDLVQKNLYLQSTYFQEKKPQYFHFFKYSRDLLLFCQRYVYA